jgi:hypothetical protein
LLKHYAIDRDIQTLDKHPSPIVINPTIITMMSIISQSLGNHTTPGIGENNQSANFLNITPP